VILQYEDPEVNDERQLKYDKKTNKLKATNVDKNIELLRLSF